MTTFRRAAGIALALYLLGGILVPAHARTRHPAFVTTARVTYYQDQGVTASGTYTTAGRTAGCAPWYMGATVTILDLGLTFQCEDTGAPWYFADGIFKLDVYSPWRPAWMQQDWYDVEVDQ